MSLRLSGRRAPRGTDGASLRKWAMVFLSMGIVGRCILQNAMLGMNSVTNGELLALLDTAGAMPVLTAALVCQVMETCATPLFAFMLVEGFLRTSSFEKYLLRVGAVALIAELPYNLAMNGSLLSLGTRNPVFGMAIALVMLYFFSRYAEKSVKNVMMKALIFAAAFLWCVMLSIDHGTFVIIFTLLLWAAREKSNIRALFAFCAAMICTMFNMYYIGACLSCIFLHGYNEERGEQNRIFNYAFYPAILLILGIGAKFI